MAEQQGTDRDALLEQQRVLAEFGDLALKTEDLDDILDKACGLVGRALETDFAKVMELSPDGRTFKVRAGVGWKPGVVGVVSVTAVENSPEGLTLAQGSVISSNRQTERRFEYHDFMIDHGVEAFVNVLILSSKGRAAFGVLQVDSRNPRNFTQSDIEFLRSYANLLGAAIERLRAVDELRQSVRDKDLLINELNHRVKNTLATVQSIASQTLRNASTIDHASHAIESRLIALSRVHDVLTESHWAAVPLDEIVGQAIAPYRSRGENRFHIQGPPRPDPAAHGAGARNGVAGIDDQRGEIWRFVQWIGRNWGALATERRRRLSEASSDLGRDRGAAGAEARPARVRDAAYRTEPGPGPRWEGQDRVCANRSRLLGGCPARPLNGRPDCLVWLMSPRNDCEQTNLPSIVVQLSHGKRLP